MALPRTTPNTTAPQCTGGDVFKVTKIGSSIYVAGAFTAAGGNTRNKLAAYDAASGTVQAWNPNANGDCYKIIPGPGGTVFVCGGFSTISGTNRNKVAKISNVVTSAAPAVDATFAPPAINAGVYGLAYDPTFVGNGTTLNPDGALYIAGDFTTVGATGRTYFACLNARTGTLQPWAPNITNVNTAYHPGRRVILGKHATDQSSVYLIGAYDTVNGVGRKGGVSCVAKNPTAATPAVDPWTPDVQGSAAQTAGDFGSQAHDVDIKPDGTKIIVSFAGGGTTQGFDGNHGVCWTLVQAGVLNRQNARDWQASALGDSGDHNSCGCDDSYAYFGHHGNGVNGTTTPNPDGRGNSKCYGVLWTGAVGGQAVGNGWITGALNGTKGVYTIELDTDRLLLGGNLTAPRTGMVQYDRTASPAPLTAPVLSQPTVTGTTVSASWTAASGGTSPYSYLVSYDGGTFQTPASGATGFTDTRTLTPGAHTLVVRVTDNTAATATSNTANINVASSLAAPTITAPTNGTTVTLATALSVWNAATGGTAPYTYSVSYDGGAFVAASGAGGLSDSHTFTNGAHTLAVRVTDSTNATATTGTVSFTISALTAGAITAPTANQSFPTGGVTATWNAATGGTAPYTYAIQYDSTAFRAPTGNLTDTPVSYQWRKSFDWAGGFSNCIAPDPTTANRFAVGGDLWGVFTTADQGQSFQPGMFGRTTKTGASTNGLYMRACEWSKKTPGKLYIGWGGLNGGTGIGTFATVTNTFTYTDVETADYGFASVTADAGARPRSTGRLIAIDYDNSTGIEYIYTLQTQQTGSQAVILRSTNGGTTVTPLFTTGVTSAGGDVLNGNWKSIAVIDTDADGVPDTILAASYRDTTTDGTTNTGSKLWKLTAGTASIRTATGPSQLTITQLSAGIPAVINDMVVASDGSIYAACGPYGVYHVTNGGATWTAVSGNSTFTGLPYFVGAIDEVNGHLAVGATRNGNGNNVAVSDNLGSSWSWVTTSTVSHNSTGQICSVAWGTTLEWWLMATGAPSFTNYLGGSTYDVQALRFDPHDTTGNTIIATGSSGAAWLTQNKGVNWRPAVIGLNGGQVSHVNPGSGGTVTIDNTDFNGMSSTNYLTTGTRLGSAPSLPAASITDKTDAAGNTYRLDVSTLTAPDLLFQQSGTTTFKSIADTFARASLFANSDLEVSSDGHVYVAQFGGGTLVGDPTTNTLANGTHTVRVRVTDSVGTVVTTSATTFQVGALTAAAITAPINGATLSNANVTTAWSAASGGTSPYTYAVSYDSGAFTAATGLSDSHLFGNGIHTIQVRATDSASRTALSSIVTITVNATVSAAVITPPPNPITTSTYVTTWTAATSGAGGITYQISYNNGVSYATPTSGPTGLSDSHTFVDGNYAVIVKATDANSTVAASVTVAYSVQTAVPPPPVIDTGPTPTAGGTTTSTNAQFTFHESGNTHPVTFQGFLNSGTPVAVTSPKTFSGLAPGTYTFNVIAIDTVTTFQSTPTTWTWTVQAVTAPPAPVITSGPTLGGTSGTQTVTINNTGDQPLLIGQINITGSNSSLFNILTDNASNTAIAPGTFATVQVNFTPATVGTFAAILNIPNSDNTTYPITLNGSATPAGTTSASVNPLSLAFGTVIFGQVSPAKTLTVTNSGTLPVTFGPLVVTGSQFALAADTVSSQTLQPNQTATVNVTYTPGSPTESATGDILFPYSSAALADQSLDVPLTGSAIATAPAITFSSPTLDFATVNVGITSSPLTVTVRNTGTANLVMGICTIIGTNGGDFAISSDSVSSQTIAPGATANISATFTPTATGTRTAKIRFPDNVTGSPQTVNLTGQAVVAVPIASISPSSVSFATTKLHATSANQTVTLTNTGSANLVVSGVSLTGANPGQFHIQTDNATGQTITPSGNRTVVVNFKPTHLGVQTANLTFSDNAGGGQQAIPLGGTAIVADVQPLDHTVYSYYYPSYGLSTAEGFPSESYQGWGATVPAPSGSGTTHAYTPPNSVASDFYPADYWTGATGYPPAIYSSSDTTVLKAQCLAAIAAGINVLVVSWAPPPDRRDTLIPALLTAAQAASNQVGTPLFISFLIEPWASSSFTDPVNSTAVSTGRTAAATWHAVNYLNSTYGSHPHFYRTARTGWNYAGRVGGANVFFLNHPEYDFLVSGSPNTIISGAGSFWQTTNDSVHNAGIVPLGGLVLAESAFTPNNVNTQHFDGGFVLTKMPLQQSGAYNVSVFQFDRTYTLGFPPTAICVPAVSPGYSGWRTQDTLNRRFSRSNGSFYNTQWNQALNGVALYDIAVSSWNDWQHGTQIEPATNQTGGTGL